MLKRTLRVAGLYAETGDWVAVRSAVFDQNVFQSTKINTISADYSEIKRRLVTLSPQSLDLLSQASADTAKFINLIAIYNVYPVFREFMSEFVYGRVQMGNRELVRQHFLLFIEELKLREESLRYKRDVTVKKSAGFIFQILRETGLLNGENLVQPLLPYEIEGLPELAGPAIRRALLQ